MATTSYATYPQFRDTWVRQVSGGGALMDAGRIMSAAATRGFTVETFDNRWLVCWQNNWSHNSPNSILWPGLSGPTSQAPRSASPIGSSGHPDIAVGPDYAAFVWRQNTLANADNNVQCRIRPDGTRPCRM